MQPETPCEMEINNVENNTKAKVDDNNNTTDKYV